MEAFIVVLGYLFIYLIIITYLLLIRIGVHASYKRIYRVTVLSLISVCNPYYCINDYLILTHALDINKCHLFLPQRTEINGVLIRRKRKGDTRTPKSKYLALLECFVHEWVANPPFGRYVIEQHGTPYNRAR